MGETCGLIDGCARDYRMVRPERVAELEAEGWRVVGATAYGAGDVSVLMARDVPETASDGGMTHG